MPSLLKKTIKGRCYYYVVWSARVNGKPRHVRQVYLGPAEAVVARLVEQVVPAQAPPGSYAVNREFGASAALWGLAQELDLVKLIDDQVPQLRSGALSVGQYLVLAAINRCVVPTSKRTMKKWYAKSCISSILEAPSKALEGQRFWDAMDQMSEGHIQRIEEKLVARVHQLFKLDLRRVLFDATNFFTFIKTTTAADLPQRGHNKAKRDDLRQVSLALLVAHDFGIPLFHHTYAGNISDPTEFDAALDPMVTRLKKLGANLDDVTIVFDKGNNSEANFKRLEKAGLSFVGSLPPSQHKDLLKVPLTDFVGLPGRRLAGVTAYRTTKKVFGHNRTIVMTWNPRLHKGQEAALLTYLEKKTRALREIQQRLQRLPQQRPATQCKTTVDTVKRELQRLLTRKEVKQCIEYHIDTKDGLPTLTYQVDPAAVQQLRDHLYGRNLIVTNRGTWSNEDIVLAYRGQYKLEHQFRNMKDPHALCWWPRFHWTDQKIRVHAFYCVLGLLLLSLLQRKLAHHGLDITIPAMLEELRGIQETTQVIRVSPSNDSMRTTTTLTKLSTLQEKMYHELNLEQYVPRGVLGTTIRRRRKRLPAND